MTTRLSPGAWRLLIESPETPSDREPPEAACPGLSMAIDETLLDDYIAGEALPTLRLYGWRSPVVTVGRHQAVTRNAPGDSPASTGFGHPFPLDRCESIGLPAIRRPTGGRAILHHDEVTVSFTGFHEGLGIVESHHQILEGVRIGLLRLGLRIEWGAACPAENARWASCFASAARCDLIAVSTRRGSAGFPRPLKVAGGAQCRRGRALLQQATVPIEWDRERYSALFGNDPADDGAGCLTDFAANRPSWHAAAMAIMEGFQEAWGKEAERGQRTARERNAALRLHDDRYRPLTKGFNR